MSVELRALEKLLITCSVLCNCLAEKETKKTREDLFELLIEVKRKLKEDSK